MIYSTNADSTVAYGSFGITFFHAFETLQYYIVLCHSEGRADPEPFYVRRFCILCSESMYAVIPVRIHDEVK